MVVDILLADDEELTLSSLYECVKEAFPEAQIDSFEDGVPAWESAFVKKYDVVITDITMRHMDGDQLARRIHEKDPDTHILFETGDIERNLVAQGIQPERCIYKPFSAASIRWKMERLEELPPFSSGRSQRIVQEDSKELQEKKVEKGRLSDFWKRRFAKKRKGD